MTNDQRYNKPSGLRKLPETLIFVDKEFYTGDKNEAYVILRIAICEYE